jgi:hypothetical protein
MKVEGKKEQADSSQGPSRLGNNAQWRKERNGNYKMRISEEEAIMRSLKHKGIRSGEQRDEGGT